MLRIDSRALSARLAKLDLSQRKRLLSSLQEILPKPKRTKYMLETLTEKQEAFLCLDNCFEVLLGGAAGPGKSIGLFQAALQYVDVPEYAALLVRRTAPELYASGGLIDISKKYLAGTDAQWNGSTKRWTFPTGKQPSILEFQHYEAGIKGQQKKYGGTYQCVEQGTLLFVSGNSLKPIEEIKVGDLVMTLQGLKKVTKIFGARTTQCIEAIIFNSDGIRIGTQIHPTNHKILTPVGWVSYNDIPDVFPPSDFSESTLSRLLGIPALPFGKKFQLSERNFLRLSSNLEQSDGPYQSLSYLSENGAVAVLPADDRNIFVTSGGKHLRYQRPVSSFCPVVLYAPDPQSSRRNSGDYVLPDAQLGSGEVEDYRERYSAYFGHDDVPILCQLSSVQESLPLRAYVEAYNRACWMPDGLADIPKYNQPHLTSYVHPYTKADQFSSEAVRFGTCFLTPVGNRTVYDLTVQDVNHYITSSTLINQNCICVDEVTEFQENEYRFLFRSLRRPEDMDVPLRMRCASNPIGVRAPFIKQRFIVEGNKTVTEQILDIAVTYERRFVPAKLDDNPFIDRTAYIRSLGNLEPHLLQALLNGDWDVKPPGKMFRREKFKID